MYVNEKMIPVEATPGIREGRIKKSSRREEFMHDMFDTF
jgi:hypothetical protein